jgi:hypothetical protein
MLDTPGPGRQPMCTRGWLTYRQQAIGGHQGSFVKLRFINSAPAASLARCDHFRLAQLSIPPMMTARAQPMAKRGRRC